MSIGALKKAMVILLSGLLVPACMKDESFYPGDDTDSVDTVSSDSSGNPSNAGTDDPIDGGEDTSFDSETASEPEDSDSSAHVSMESEADAPVVGGSHSGWMKPLCAAAACHGDIESQVETSAGCARCHGDNGAPPCAGGNQSYCLDCHSNPHDEQVGTVDADCIVCHV